MVLIRIFLTGIDKSSYLAYEEGKVVSCGVEEKHSYHDNVLINVVSAEIEFTIEGLMEREVPYISKGVNNKI